MISIIGVALLGILTLYPGAFTGSNPVQQPQPAQKQAVYSLQSASEPMVTPSPNIPTTNTLVKTPSPKQITIIPTQIAKVTESQKNTTGSLGINLNNWKLTLPIGDSKPTEIRQPELANFRIDPWYVFAPAENEARFRAAVNGTTTNGSKYPRSEFREMINNGTTNANWSSTNGTHTMLLDEAITATPMTKKHVVAGQIHDSNDDILVIRLEYPNLYVNVNGKNVFTLDSNYTLGKRFQVKLGVSNGQTKVYFNNSQDPVYTLDKSYSGAYFKAGAYTQSNCSKEETDLCNDNNYGEVIIYSLSVNHQ